MQGNVRRDIQLLRGIAVLVVVFFHSSVGYFENGYLGVDVFFVVSGFLITTIILKGLDNNSFSFQEFYLRRAKRLLPALYSTLLFTTLLAYFFITPSQIEEYINQLIGAVSFSSNMVLPTQVGYFESESEGKPLLHIWSLSLEEQYYFTLPLFLFLIPRKTRITALVGLCVISFVWCLVWSSSPDEKLPFLWRISDSTSGEWAFFLFPTRAWELLAGSICAWIMLNKPVNIPPYAKLSSIIVILIMSCISIDSIHPRGDALIVVLSTAIILLGSKDWLPKNSIIHAVERIGDWSYSIYLVHWPLFSFAYLGYVADVPVETKMLLVFLSLLLGFFQYKYVELPFRFGWKEKQKLTWGKFGFATVLVMLLPVPLAFGTFSNQISDYEFIRRINFGLSSKCDRLDEFNKIASQCQTSSDPTIAVWGDSYAMHLVPGLLESNKKVVQLTKSVCGPILGIAPVSDRYQSDWGSKCIEYNDDAFDLIIKNKTIDVVIMSSALGQYFNSTSRKLLVDGRVIEDDGSYAEEMLVKTIEKLIDNNKTPIIFSPPPRDGSNIGECLEREATNSILFRSSCSIKISEYKENNKEIIDRLRSVVQKTDVSVVWIPDLICDDEICLTKKDDIFLFRDEGHLSIEGSKKILGEMKIDLVDLK
ncbi:MAG: acyltransferase [Motiliproteus sp.]|nr:acyltransferase [Motiliproteus sp.]MCW9053677.1 acyltransferase [Motiliproteus sp.]